MMVASRSSLVLARIESMRDRNYAYSSCDRCYSKVLFDGDTSNWVCLKCRSNRPNVLRRYRMNFRITDNTRLTNVTVFGSNLDKFFGCTADEFYQNLNSLSQIHPQLINENLVDSTIEETFVGYSFLFGFKLPHGKSRDDVGNFPMTLPNQDGSSFADTVAWQMLFACSDSHFLTVLERIRRIADDFGSSQSSNLNSVVNENSVFSTFGSETVPLVSQNSVERQCIDSTNRTIEESLVLSCDQEHCANVESKELTQRPSGHSSVRSLNSFPGDEISFVGTMTNEPVLTNLPNACFKTSCTNAQFRNDWLSKCGQVFDVSKGYCDSGFCSDVLGKKDKTIPAKLNEVNENISGSLSSLHADAPELLERESNKKSQDDAGFDEIEICRAVSVRSQEGRVFVGDFSFNRGNISTVSQEIKKKCISRESLSSQLDIPVTTTAQHHSCTLDLVEAPYSEDLEAFLKDYELNERLTCELSAVPASDSKSVVCGLESVSRDADFDAKISRDWEQPYSEDLDEFLKGQDSEKRLSQVLLKPLHCSSTLQQIVVEDSFTLDTVALKPVELHDCPLVSSMGSFTKSRCSEELFSFWSDDFEQQVAHSSISKSMEKPKRHCSSKQSLTESPQKHLRGLSCHSRNNSKILHRNSLQQSSGQSRFSLAKAREICSIATVNETKENVQPRAKLFCASAVFDSSSLTLSGHSKNSPRRIRKSIRKTISDTATPPVIFVNRTASLSSFSDYKTPVNATSRSRVNAFDSFSSKNLHRKTLENCTSRNSMVTFKNSTRKVENTTVATPVDHSFDLFQSPCFIRTGSSHIKSRKQAGLPGSSKFQFSSTPLNSFSRPNQQSSTVVQDFTEGLADCNFIADESDCIAGTVVPVSLNCTCRLKSYMDRTSSVACEITTSTSANLTKSISPELFANSLQEHVTYEISPCQAIHSRIVDNHKETPIACNLFNSPSDVNRTTVRDSLSGLLFNQSDDLFGSSADLFLDSQ